ncbi:MAG: hypothetical protein GF388_00835, partial [Candidatus Aegiribacteria sp.]|nr:hypothetical protein [Candidatus Aegiribacteria sp.]MBD3293960.1 hypothetical protein [Candidatus Fermentibacteria bacterium]
MLTAEKIGLAFLAAISVSAILTPLARRTALKLGMVDRPKGRKKHMISTPLLGGMAIYISFLLTVIAGMFLFQGTESLISLDWQALC